MIDAQTRVTIKGYLEGFIQGMVDEMTRNKFNPKELRPVMLASKKGNLKPFHESLLPDGILRIAEFERSFSTKLGTTFEECARLIAKSIHADAQRGYRVKGFISPEAIKQIEEITSHIGSGGMKTNYHDLIKQVIDTSSEGSSLERISIADLYIRTKTGEDLYFEIKSPKPNKGQCIEATGRLLQIYALTKANSAKTQAFYATAYNPYGVDKKTFNHSFVLNYMDLEHEVLVGEEFWNLVGGEGTYEELLSIYQEVGKEKGHHLIDKLALGY